jgi:hypothetical protein
MLTIRKVRTFKKTVPVKFPSPTVPDTFDEGSFVAVFKALSRSEIEAAQKRAADKVAKAAAIKAGEAVDDGADNDGDREFLRSILLGAEGLGDDEGNPLDPVAGRDAVIEDMTMCLAAVEVFNEQWAKAKSGN